MAKHNICHVEWASTNLERTGRFYGGLFGWTFEPWGEEYLLFSAPEGIGGGFWKVPAINTSQSPTVYIQVDEIEPYLARAVELGGGVAVPKTQIAPEVGWFAHLRDPDGNIVGVYQSAHSCN